MRLVKNMTILVVEDDEGLRYIICKSLRHLGYDVFEATQGEEAFDVLKKEGSIELVLSDIRMPGGSGMDLLKRIQTEMAEPPIVVLMTGFTDVIFSVAIAAGAHSIITKPFTIQALVKHIEDIREPFRKLIVF